jgi:phosphoribosylformimino-5-aminoimidazole carboxamide ribotide isomerase
MLIIPAIDLREGRCVRLFQGRPDQETVYSDDPVAVAQGWEAQGARWLHVVDLDGAFAGHPGNGHVVLEIVRNVGIPVQVGGGVRNLETVRYYLEHGVARVILGTGAVTDPGFLREATTLFGERIVVGVDCRDGQVCVHGWEKTVTRDGLAFLEELVRYGVRRIIFTDIKRDGTLEGPNLEAIARFAAHTALKLIASGGVSRLEDIRALKALETLGVDGVIIGKALYAGAFTLAEALRVAEGEE